MVFATCWVILVILLRRYPSPQPDVVLNGLWKESSPISKPEACAVRENVRSFTISLQTNGRLRRYYY